MPAFLSQVLGGYRLPQPQGCLDDLYSVMMKCWAQRPTDRPHFKDVLNGLICPLEASLDGRAKRPSTGGDDSENKR